MKFFTTSLERVMTSLIIAALERKFSILTNELKSEPSNDHLKEIAEFKQWFSDELEKGKIPAFLIRKYTESLNSLESSLSSGEEWKVKRELRWQGVQLEKSQISTIESFNPDHKMGPLTDDVTVIENKTEEHITIGEDYTVLILKSLTGCVISIGECKMLNLSNLSNCQVTMKQTGILYVNQFINGSITGSVRNQTRLHNSIDSELNISTSNIVIEDCFNLGISHFPGIKVEDFNHPGLSEETDSFHWVN